MYKLTWYDCNCSPICDGTVSFLVTDLEAFERNLQGMICDERCFVKKYAEDILEKLQRAMAGEHFTDWYGGIQEHPELEFLQEDKGAKVLEERTWHSDEKEYELVNTYLWASHIKSREAEFTLKSILFLGGYYLTASYELKGVASKSLSGMGEKEEWQDCTPYGNPILEASYTSGKDERGEFSLFTGDTLRTVCEVILRKSDDPIPLPEILVDDYTDFVDNGKGVLLERIMADIPGEAG